MPVPEASLGQTPVPERTIAPGSVVLTFSAPGRATVRLPVLLARGEARRIALKLPLAGPHSQELAERFTRERDILGELSHPNIARLDDAGVTAFGQPFLALEYVPGLPLTDYCNELGLDIRARLRLYMQVLRAVQHAHGHLVIHRDLKPSNVIVTPQGQAMLLDHGAVDMTAIYTTQAGRPHLPIWALQV